MQEKEESKRKVIEEREAKKQASQAAKEAAQAARDAKKTGKGDDEVEAPAPVEPGPSTATPDYAAALLRPAGLAAPSSSTAGQSYLSIHSSILIVPIK
jgi:hypothetical protein